MPKGKRKNLNKSVQVETTEELDGLNTSMQNPNVQSPLESDDTQPQEEPQQEREPVEGVDYPTEEESEEYFKIESADPSNQVVSNNNAEITQDEIQQESEPIPPEEEEYADGNNNVNDESVENNSDRIELDIPVTEEPLSSSQIEELNKPKGVRVLGENENPYEENSQEEPQKEDVANRTVDEVRMQDYIEEIPEEERDQLNNSMENPTVKTPFESDVEPIESSEQEIDTNEIQNDINAIEQPQETASIPATNEVPETNPSNQQPQETAQQPTVPNTQEQQEIPSIPATPETPPVTQQNTTTQNTPTQETPPVNPQNTTTQNTPTQQATTQQTASSNPSDPYFSQVVQARAAQERIQNELLEANPQTNEIRKVNADDINRLLDAERKLAEISTKALQDYKSRGIENTSLQAVNRLALDNIKALENAPMDGSVTLIDALNIGRQRSQEKQVATQQTGTPNSEHPYFNDVQKALRARMNFQKTFMQPSPLTGELVPMGKDGIKNMLELEQNLVGYTTKAIQDYQNRGVNIPSSLALLHRQTRENIQALKEAPEDGSVTLMDVMLAARSHNINVNPAAMQRFNNQPQPYMPMQLRNARGVQVPGVFVPGDPMQYANQNTMGQMARMYGCGALVGQSYPVTLQTPGGQPVPGTFMRYMPGTDLAHPMYNDPYFLSNAGMYTNTSALRSVANLNALDYVCGTNGRGPTDMTYSFNGNGTFDGVCGVWNNNAFATNPVMGADSVPVIGSNMANAMMNTPPDFAAAQMYNNGMDPQQVQATLARIQQLLSMIMGGLLPVVPNSQWRNMNLNNLAAQTPQNATSNAFNSLQYVSNAQYPYMQQYALQQKYAPQQQQQRQMYPGFTPQQGMQYPGAPQQGGAGMQGYAPQNSEYATMLAKMQAFNKGLKKMSLLTDSQEYKNVRQYSEYMEKELTRMVKNPQTLDAGMQGEMFKRSQVNQMMENLSNLTDAYLDRRGNHTKSQPTSRSENRDMWMRMMNSYARSNSSEPDKDAGTIFRDQLDTDDVRINMAKTRKNSYRAMDPAEVGKLIKRTVKVSDWLADMHPKMYATTHNGAQDLLTGYLNKVKNFNPKDVGLTKKDVEAIRKIGVNNPQPQKAMERTQNLTVKDTPEQITRFNPNKQRQNIVI